MKSAKEALEAAIAMAEKMAEEQIDKKGEAVLSTDQFSLEVLQKLRKSCVENEYACKLETALGVTFLTITAYV